MYADTTPKTIEDLQYLVNLAANTESKKDRLTLLNKADLLLHAIIAKESVLGSRK